MRLLRRAGKRFYTLAYGADNRRRERTLASGKFNFCMHCPEPGKFCVCNDLGGERMFETIARYTTQMLALGLALDMIPRARPLQYLIVDPSQFTPIYPVADCARAFRVVHAPNHPHFKGTRYLEQAVTRLQQEGYLIELILVSGLSNRELMNVVGSADLVADQFIGGSFGYAAVEAMALGKPVLCYVRDSIRASNPDSLPIINASPDDLHEKLRDILQNRHSLPEIGRRSRQYVERYHSLTAFTASLRAIRPDSRICAARA